jgi:hypothetical protein
MFQIVKRNPLAAVLAVLMHVAIIAFMLVGVGADACCHHCLYGGGCGLAGKAQAD